MKYLREPTVRTEIEILDLNFSFEAFDPITVERIASRYYSGGVTVMLNFPFENKDLKTIQSVGMPSGRRFQKLSFEAAMAPPLTQLIKKILRPRRPQIFIDACGLRHRRLNQVSRALASLDEALKLAVKKIFPLSADSKISTSIRLSETPTQNLHLDSYKNDVFMQDKEVIRLFANIDSIDRIWSIGETAEEYASHYLGSHARDGEVLIEMPDSYEDFLTRDTLSQQVNRHCLGNGSVEHSSGMAKHTLCFPPQSAWLLDTRRVAHQVIFGRRAMGLSIINKVPIKR